MGCRLTGEYGEADSFRSGIDSKIEMISPSFTYKNDDETLTWTTQYTYDKLGRVPDRGPSYSVLPAGTSIKTGFAQEGDYGNDVLQVIRSDVSYEFAPNWTFHWAASYRQAEQNFDHFFQSFRFNVYGQCIHVFQYVYQHTGIFIYIFYDINNDL